MRCGPAATPSMRRWARCWPSFACEPLLTGLGAGRLHAGRPRRRRAGAARLLRRGARPRRRRGARARARAGQRLVRRRGADVQHRAGVGGHVRHARRGVRGVAAVRARPAGPARGARGRGSRATGVALSPPAGLHRRDPRGDRHLDAGGAALFAPDGRLLARGGARCASRSWATRCERLAAEGPRPFYDGDIGRAIVDWLGDARRAAHRGGSRRLRGGRPRAAARRATAAARSSPTRRRRPGGSSSPGRWRMLDGAAGAAAGHASSSSTSMERPRTLAHAGVPRRASTIRGSSQRFLARPAARLGLDDAHRRARRRRAGRAR